MSQQTLAKYFSFDNIIKVGTFLGIVGLLYIQQHFVTVERFEAHIKDETTFSHKVTETLSAINTSIVLLQQNGTILQDHESRIRALQVLTSDHESRIKVHEMKVIPNHEQTNPHPFSSVVFLHRS